MAMASSGVRAPTCLCSLSPSSTAIKASIFNTIASSSVSFHSKTSSHNLYSLCSPKGLGHFSPWSGLKHLGLSVTWRSLKFEKRKCRDRVAYASLFGVGAPEALVIGVVALLVFGPKGLAEVARSLGKTLRAFQPTIRELQEVSREFKSTLEKEIGLDEISNTTPRTGNYNASTTSTTSSVSSTQESNIGAEPNGTSSNNAYSTEEYLKVTEEQLQAAAAQQQEQTSPQPEGQLEAQADTQDDLSSKIRPDVDEDVKSTGQPPIVASSEGEEQKVQTSSPEATMKETAG